MADPLLLNPDDLQPDAAPGIDELEALLAEPVAPHVVIPVRELVEQRLEEAIFDELKHPRWPKGTKGLNGENIGGKFMRAGQTFMLDGKRWEIQSVSNGHVIADEASGNIANAETRVFEPSAATIDGAKVPVIKGASYAEPWVLQSGTGKFQNEHNTPVVDADTHPESHDPKIKPPADSDLTAAEWKRFGRADQLYYVELMGRYGKWAYADKSLVNAPAFLHSKAKQAIDKASQELNDYNVATQLTDAFSSQKGQSKGYDLDFASLFTSLATYGQSKDQLAGVWKNYEHVREAERDLNGVIAWDLYNRVRAPDVSLRHRSQNGTGWWQDVILGKTALMSGPSSHWSVDFAWNDPNSLGYVTPIRNLAMFTDVAGYEGQYGEHEVATANRMKLGPDTSAFWTPSQLHEDSSNPLWKWLKGQMGKKPAGGHVMRAFAAHLLGKGDLPLPPPDADFTWVHQPGKAGEKTYAIPPDDFMAKVEAAIAKNPGKYEGGVTDPEEAAKPIDELNLKPGDVVEGSTAGLRYLVIKDTAGTMGLSYLALGKGIAGNYDSGDKKFTFGSPESKRKKIDLHFDIPAAKPKPKTKAPVYSQAEWKPDGPKLPVKQFKVGDKLRFNQDDWEVLSKSPTLVTLKSLTTGGEGTVNAGWPTQKLAPVKPFEPTEGQLVTVATKGMIGSVTKVGKQASWVLLPSGEKQSVLTKMLSPAPSYAPDVAAKGDTFSKDGQKYVVTNVLKKNKHVKAHAAKAGALVEDFAPEHPALESLFRPDDYALGAKAKVGQLEAGTLVSGSLTAKRPYMVLGAKGPHAWLVNLDSGEQVQVGINKSYPLLVTHAETEVAAPMVAVAGQKPHSDWQVGDKVMGTQLQQGDLFQVGLGDKYQVTKVLIPGAKIEINKLAGSGAKGYNPFPLSPVGMTWTYAGHDDIIHGAPGQPPAGTPKVMFAKDMQVGDQFSHSSIGGPEWTVVASTGGAAWDVVTPEGHHTVTPFGSTAYVYSGPSVGSNVSVSASPPVASSTAELPQATFVPFKSGYGSGGKYKHNKLNEFSEGQLVYDKAGGLWKVKQAGATPIVTDGTSNYQVDGALKGKAYEHGKPLPFADNSPPVSGLDKQQLDQMTPNVLGKSLLDLGLAKGDKFVAKGQAWTVTSPGGTLVLSATGSLGTSELHKKAVVPSHYTKVASGLNEPGKTLQDLDLHKGDKVKIGSSWFTLWGGYEPAGPGGGSYPTPTGGFIAGYHVPLGVEYAPGHGPAEALPEKPDLFSKADSTVAASTLEPYSVAETKQGKLIYKTLTDAWFPLGGNTASKIKTTQVFPVTVSKPDVSDWQNGPEMPVGDAPVGSVVQGGVGKQYLVLAHGEDGMHGMDLASGEIAFSGGHKAIHVLVPPSDVAPAAPVMQSVKDMPVGTLFKTGNESVVKKLADEQHGMAKLEMLEPGSASKLVKGHVWSATIPGDREVVSQPPVEPLTPFEKLPSATGEWTELPPDTSLKDVAPTLEVGDQFKTQGGSVYTFAGGGPGKWKTEEFGVTFAGGLTVTAIKQSGDWPPLPAAVDATDMPFVPGDQFKTPEGDVHTVVSAQQGQVETTWHPANSPSSTFGPLVYYKGELTATAAKYAGGQAPVPSPAPAGQGLKPGSHGSGGGYQWKFSGKNWDGPGAATANGLHLGVGDEFKNKTGTFKITAVDPDAGFLEKYTTTNLDTGDVKMWGNPAVKQYKKQPDLGAAVANAVKAAPVPKTTQGKPFVQTTNFGVANAFYNSEQAANSSGSMFTTVEPDGSTALHSYDKVIALFTPGETAYFTTAKFSVTSSKHLSAAKQHVGMFKSEDVSQADLESMVAGAQHPYVPSSPVKATAEEPAVGQMVSPSELNVGDKFKNSLGGVFEVKSKHGKSFSFVKLSGQGSNSGGVQFPTSTVKYELYEKAAPPAAIKTFALNVTPTGSAGGTTGAQWAIHDNDSYILKGYGGNQNRVATEALANAIYQKLGVNVAAGGLIDGSNVKYGEPGKKSFIAPIVSGDVDTAEWTDQQKEAFAKDYVADALLGSYDHIGLDRDNVLWQNSGATSDALTPVRVDQGGTLRYRAQGKLKDYGPVPDEMWSMLLKGQAGQNGLGAFLSENELRSQAGKVAGSLSTGTINELVDAAPFSTPEMKEQVRKSLISRVNWLTAFAHGGGVVPPDVKELLAPNGPEPKAMPIKPYTSKWASGGAFTYKEISSLIVGQQFRDKDGKLFTVDGQIATPGKSGPMDNLTFAIPEGGFKADAVLVPHTFTNAAGKVKLTRVKLVNST